jgi:general stress protein 26
MQARSGLIAQKETIMPTPQDLEQQFWNALTSDMTMMLGLDAVENERPPFWFFTANDTELVRALSPDSVATATFTSKGHDLFATVYGSLRVDNDRDVIERLWNPFVAAWYEGGKDDPKLVLLRLNADQAHIWQNATSLFAGIKLLLGVDPKKEYKDKVATVSLS